MAYLVLAAQALGLLVMIFICTLLWGDALKTKTAADGRKKETPTPDQGASVDFKDAA